MPKRSQTKDEHDAVRLRLIEAARELNNTEGPTAVTLRNVARRAGYSPAAMYRYFSDVDDLIRSTWADTLYRLRAWLEQALAGVQGPLPRLRAVLLAIGSFAEANLVAFRTTFFLLIRKPSQGARIYDDYLAQSPFALLLAEVQAAMDAGAIRPDDANLTAQTLWGFLHGVLALDQTVSEFPFLNRRERLLHAVDVAVAGLRSAPGREKEVGPGALPLDPAKGKPLESIDF